MLIFYTIAIVITATFTLNALTINSSSLLLPNRVGGGGPTSNVTDLGIPFQRICRAPRFPGGISPESCADALLQIDPTDRVVRTYAVRLSGGGARGVADVSLPRRYISCEFSMSFFMRGRKRERGLMGVGVV